MIHANSPKFSVFTPFGVGNFAVLEAISVALWTVRVDYITFVSIEVVSDILVSRTDKCYPLYPLVRQNTTLVEIDRYKGNRHRFTIVQRETALNELF